MKVAPVPPNEPHRLAKIAEWCVLHQPQSSELAALVEMARRYFSMPICLVSIVGECEQWFMAKGGLAADATPGMFHSVPTPFSRHSHWKCWTLPWTRALPTTLWSRVSLAFVITAGPRCW